MFEALGQAGLWATVAHALSWACIGAGALLCIVGGIGMLRLPDLYTRVHAASVADTGGMLLILLGLLIQAGIGLVAIKLVLIIAFLLITSPTATHAMARAARQDGVDPVIDDDKDDQGRTR